MILFLYITHNNSSISSEILFSLTWTFWHIKLSHICTYLSNYGISNYHQPVVKRAIAFIQENSAASTWSAFSFSTCSWNILMWSMKATTLSAAMGLAWRPAAARRGAMWRGMLHWAAFSTNSSDQTSLSSATWSVNWSSGNPAQEHYNDYSSNLH